MQATLQKREQGSRTPKSGSAGGDEASQGLGAVLYGVAGGFEDGVGLAIEGFAAPENAAKIAHGLAALRDGATVALTDDAGHVLFGFGAEPDGEALSQQKVVGDGIGDDAAAGSQNEAGVSGEDAVERVALHAAVAGDAVEIEDDGEGKAGIVFDLFIELEEGTLERLGEQAAERGFAGAAQAGEGDARAAQSGISAAKFFEKKLVRVLQIGSGKFFKKSGGLLEGRRGRHVFGGEGFDGYVEGDGEIAQAGEGDITAAAFEVIEEAHGEGALSGELFLGQAATSAEGAETLSQSLQVGVQG